MTEQAAAQANDDFDSPWKEVLELYFEDFLYFFFLDAAAGIDWQRGHRFLDKELQQVSKDAELGRRYADKLVQVYRKDGEEVWVLIHVEIQAQPDSRFSKRMFTYNYRIFDHYDRPVVSLAVLADHRVDWRPDAFTWDLWGCRVGIHFPVVKLLDYATNWTSLESSINPFALCTMAHLKAMETRKDLQLRRQWKVDLARRLYDQGRDREYVINLFRFIDWIMTLPEELTGTFWQEIQAIEEEKAMPYVTSIERLGIQQGMQKGMQQGMQQGTRKVLLRLLTKKFSRIPADIKKKVELADEEQLLRWSEMILSAKSIGEVFGE